MENQKEAGLIFQFFIDLLTSDRQKIAALFFICTNCAGFTHVIVPGQVQFCPHCGAPVKLYNFPALYKLGISSDTTEEVLEYALECTSDS